MKVLHVVSSLAPRLGGLPAAAIWIAHAEAAAGANVALLTTDLNYPKGRLDRTDLQIDPHIPLHLRLFPGWRPFLWFSPGLFHTLQREIKNFDVVHIHGLYRLPVSTAGYLAHRHKVPFVMTPHGSLSPFEFGRSTAAGRLGVPLKRLYEHLIEFPNLNNAGLIHCTSQIEEKQLERLAFRAPKIVIPNGIDDDFFSVRPEKGWLRDRLGIDRLDPLILFLGRIHFKKGLDILIPAFQQVRSALPKARLAIVGPDNDGYLSKVKSWCVERGLQDSVSFIGHLDKGETIQAYRDADVFCLPSHSENFGLTVVEAMACECATVISKGVSIWPDINQADAAEIAEISSEDIATSILRVLKDPKRAKTLAENGKSFSRGYLWSSIGEKFLEAYQGIINISKN